MTKSNIIKLTIASLLLIAVALGLILRAHELFNGNKPISQTQTGASSLADYYQIAQQNAAQTDQTSTVTFLAAGDIMLSRGVALNVKNADDVDLPFRQITDVLKSTDFNFANLESPVAPGQPVIGGNSMVFGAPSDNLTALKDYNFQIVNLANNHAFDQGLAGIDATRSALNGLGIVHEGTGDNLDQAWMPALVSANGLKICFVGAAYGTNSGGSIAAKYVAEIADTDRLKSSIAFAKSECDFVVATMHAGVEYTRAPNQEQITFAHEAIDDGADMVIGAHPHWVQPIEKYQNKYIFYSLGNFVFDQDFSQGTTEGLTLKITISKPAVTSGQGNGAAGLQDLQGGRTPATLDSIELLPVMLANSQPRPATKDESNSILQMIGQTETILK